MLVRYLRLFFLEGSLTLMILDVQITKDDVPIVYHDFLMSETGIDAPLHHLNLEQVSQGRSNFPNYVISDK